MIETDTSYKRNQGDKVIKVLQDKVAIAKNNSTIAKKEVDTYFYVNKSNTDAEISYMESLINEKDRPGITTDELKNINDKIEAASIRLHECASATRQQVENSPYNKPISLAEVGDGRGFCIRWWILYRQIC